MKKAVLSTLLLASTFALAQNITIEVAPVIENNVEVADKTDAIAAPITVPNTTAFEVAADDGYIYRIWVAWPKGDVPPDGYGVMYVLDANPNFITLVEAARFQKGSAPTLLVGIASRTEGLDLKRRFWDFTPKTPEEHLLRRTSSEGTVTPEGTGGQDAFLQFIEKKLKPQIAKQYKVDSSRQAIFGHSLSARFVLHVLATNPEAFTDYLASSPSIWWDNASVLEELKKMPADKVAGKKVMITVGEFEQKTTPQTAPDRADFFAKAKMVDNARTAAEMLRKIPDLNVSFAVYEEENHGSVFPMAASRAVRFALAPKK